MNGNLLLYLLSMSTESESPLTLNGAIQIALENSAEFSILEQNLVEGEARLDLAGAYVVPTLIAAIRAGHEETPPSSTSLGGSADRIEGSIALRGLLATGLTYQLSLSSSYEAPNTVGTIYDRFFATNLRLDVVQPLLRNAWTIADAPTRIAARRQDATRHLQRARAERVLADVEVSYWILVLAHGELSVRKGALSLSEEQLRSSQTQLRHGSVSQIDVVDAEAAVARDRDAIQQSLLEVATAEGALMSLIYAAPRPVVERYVPVDEPEVREPPPAVDELVRQAPDHRPDLAAALANLEAEETAREVTENALWPAIDVVLSVGLGGVAGRLSNGYGTSGFGSFVGHNLTGQTLDPLRSDPRDEGGFFRQFENLRYPDAALGIVIDVPLAPILADASDRIQGAEIARRRSEAERLRRQVAYDVMTAYRQLQADVERVRATSTTVELSERLLEGQKTRFKNGVATSFDVLRATAAVTEARIANVRARVRSRISDARLAFARGIYLERNNIQLTGRGT